MELLKQLEKFDSVSDSARSRVYDLVLKHFQRHPESPWSGKYLVELEKTIKAFYASVNQEYQEVFRDTLPDVMKQFYDRAVKEIKTAGVYKNLIGDSDPARVSYFLESSFKQVAMRTDKMSFDHIQALRQLSAEVFRETSVTGATRKEVSKRLLERALEIKGFQFTDKGGNKWSNKSYFQMLARTELMNAGRASYDDKMAGEGFDIMKLTTSGDSCDHCAKYEGKPFSLTGATPGIPTKQDLIDAGVFHPNCTHSYSLIPAYIAREKYGIKDAKTQAELERERAQLKAATTNKSELPIEEAIKKVSGRYDKIFNPDVESSKQHKEAWVAYWQAKNKRRALESSNADPEEIRRLLRQENRLRKHLEIYRESAAHKFMDQAALENHANIAILNIRDPARGAKNDAAIRNDCAGAIRETYARFLRMFSPEYKINNLGNVEVYASDTIPRSSCLVKEPFIKLRVEFKSSKGKWGFFIPEQVHELAHAMEISNPHIAKRCKEFLKYRTKNEPSVSLNSLWLKDPRRTKEDLARYPSGPYGMKETTKPDKFFSPYCGKDYPDGTEIFSMGVQAVVQDPVNFRKVDPEYFNFIVGLMRGGI